MTNSLDPSQWTLSQTCFVAGGVLLVAAFVVDWVYTLRFPALAAVYALPMSFFMLGIELDDGRAPSLGGTLTACAMGLLGATVIAARRPFSAWLRNLTGRD